MLLAAETFQEAGRRWNIPEFSGRGAALFRDLAARGRAATGKDPGNLDARMVLARALAGLGLDVEARAEWKEIVRRCAERREAGAGDPLSFLAHAKALELLGAPAEAAELLREALDLFPGKREFLRSRIESLEQVLDQGRKKP
jgi:predicted O-linked N-acetylglucosamine transferase (SPINDLY family)